MKLKLKCAVASAIALITAFGHAAFAAEAVKEVAEEGETAAGTYAVSVGDAEMTVNKENLNLEVKKGDRVWYSGRRVGDDDGLNPVWARKVTDAVTVGYRSLNTNTTTERSLSALNPTIKFTEKSDGFEAKIRLNQISLIFNLDVKLYADKLTVSVPYESITENSDSYKLQYMLLYPFFDSSYSQTDGKIILPDGCGAEVDLSVPTSAKQGFSARVYGDDYGISARPLSSTSPGTVTLPMFALTYPDGGTMVTADGGAEYCSVNAQVSSITTNYNFAYFNWIYRETYVKYYESSGTEGKNYVAFQDDLNKFDLVQTMTFLKGDADVVDVAKAYREKVDIKKADEIKAAGLRLQFLMAESKQGMFGRETVNMTKTSYISSVAKEVAAYCDNLSASVTGYTRGGLYGSYPEHFPLDSKSGGKSGYKQLAADLKKLGASLSYVTDFVRAYESASVAEKKLALNISTQFITINDTRSGSTAKFRLTNPADGAEQLKKDLKKIKDYGGGIELLSMGSMLYSGYKNRNFSRADAVEIFRKAASSTGVKTALSAPNDYMWGVCDTYTEAPVSDSGYLIETQSVPLLQAILSGSMELYSEPINLNFVGDELILRLIDSNVYPAFLLTQQDALELYGTHSAGIFTSSYSVWKDTIKEIYEKADAALSPAAGRTMEKRYTENGVSVTEYSGGVKVAVNYGNKDADVGGTTVPARSAAAIH